MRREKGGDLREVAVVIPVYKECPDYFEMLSYKQALRILHNHDIVLITHKALRASLYEDIARQNNVLVKVEYFDEHFFTGIDSYNDLMKDIHLYKRFIHYRYILIYQLDAFVFRDELSYWCQQNYDYIGAPWFDGFKEKTEHTHPWTVGNGGFSLRKISFFIKVLSWKYPVKKIRMDNGSLFLALKRIPYYLGWRNNMRFFLRTNRKMNEDYFFTVFLKDSFIPSSIPPVDVAMKFSVEKSPRFFYARNQCQLPFGCHAYLKNDYLAFWKEFIEP